MLSGGLRDNGPLISGTHRDCQTIIQCNGSVSNGPLISGKPLLIDHYVNVLSSGLPYLTDRSFREPTTIAKRLGWPAHIGPPRHRPLTYSALFPSVCPSAAAINAGGWVRKKQNPEPKTMPDDSTPLPDQRPPLSCSCQASPDSYQLWISAAPAALLASLFEVRLSLPATLFFCNHAFWYYPVINIPLVLCETPSIFPLNDICLLYTSPSPRD